MQSNNDPTSTDDDDRFGFMKKQTKNQGQLEDVRVSQDSLNDLDKDLLQNDVTSGAPVGIELATIDIDLFNRLLKTGIIRSNPGIKTDFENKIVTLDDKHSATYQNGLILAEYMLVLKQVLRRVNQDFSIDHNLILEMKPQGTPQARLFNWNYLSSQLDKIGILIENDTKSLYVAGDSYEIGKLFTRIEKFMVRIAMSDSILIFDNYRKDDRSYQTTSHISAQGAALPEENLPGGRKGLPQQKKMVKDGVDIMQMDTDKQPSETESTLEFILNTLCRALNMRPKQSAALLTNNNQFLTHCVVKGVKSKYEPMINWYQEVYQFSRHLTVMLEIEVDNATSSKDQKQIRAAAQNFEKVLQTISCGCYSNNLEVAQLCMKTLTYIAQDFAGNQQLQQLAMKWFQSPDNGLYTINYALRKHAELSEEFVSCVGHFTGGGEQMMFVYMNSLTQYYPDQVDYLSIITQLFPGLAMQYTTELTEAGLLAQFIDKTIRFADSDGQNSAQVRIAALALLTEIWLAFGKYVEKNENYNTSLQHVFKKNVRDPTRSIRIVTATLLFKLLDKFSAEKNSAAPAIYKTLIFSLVEQPQEQTTRELFLTSFQYLFDSVKSIPIGLLIDPFVKANQVQDNFQFQTFDFDFFTFVARHPKLNIQNGIQILDLLARLYLNDVCNASAAAVPFIMISSRFIETVQCQEFVLKFITICLNQLLQLSKAGQTPEPTPPRVGGKQKTLALPAPESVKGSSNKGKEFRISTNKKKQNQQQLNERILSQEEEVNIRLKKSLIITMLLKIQNLRQNEVNNGMKDMLLGAQKNYKDQNNGYLSNGIMAVLKYWDDPDHLFNRYLKQLEKDERKDSLRKEQLERRMLTNAGVSVGGYESDAKQPSQQKPPNSLKQSNAPRKFNPTLARNSTALVPLSEETIHQRQEAQHGIQKWKHHMRRDEDYEMKMREQEEKQMRKQTINEKRLKEELMKRRVEVGIQSNVGGVKQEIKALIYKDEGKKTQKKGARKNPLDQQVSLIDFSEEEDRDREILKEFMKKYGKVWKYLFGRYANQAYSTKGKSDFDSLKEKTKQINLSEITKMLKEHNTYPLLINKDEIASLIRLLNMNSNKSKWLDLPKKTEKEKPSLAPRPDNSHEIAMLDYDQFLQFIVQCAFLCFSRPPIDKSSLPTVESLSALVLQFEQATRDRGHSTALYEDPDMTGAFGDRELIKAIEEKLRKDPSYPVPEGFTKVTEKVPVYEYKLPECVQNVISESQNVSVQIMDDILFDCLGIHFLEPQVNFDQKLKVKPTITKQIKPQAEALNYMKKADKNIEQIESKKGSAYATMSAADKRREALEVKPKLNLALKMQVTKQDLKNRPHYQEVAEVFEEMLQAVEKGKLGNLAPRLNRAPGQIINQAKIDKENRMKEEQQKKQEKENKRIARNQEVKQIIKETNHDGHGLPTQQYRAQMNEQQAKEMKQREKEEMRAFQQKAEEQHRKTEEAKKAQMEAMKEKKEQEEKEAQIKAQMDKKIRQEFLAKQKQKHKESFKDTYKRRDDIVTKKEELAKIEERNAKRLKDQITDYIKQTRPNREFEKKERQDTIDFLASEPVKDLFEKYHKQLFHMYKFYAAQDVKKDNMSLPLEKLHEYLDLTEFIRFGYHQKLTPDLLPPDVMMTIYKELLAETQDINAANKAQDPSKDLSAAGMIGYEAFKKSIIRICVMAQEDFQNKKQTKDAQEKLVGAGVKEDLLQAKLNREAQKIAAEMKGKKALQEKLSAQDQLEKQKQEKLKEQFKEELKYKEENLSKVGKNLPDVSKTETLVAKKRRELKQYELDSAALAKEEEFFKKWLKQRENLGFDKAESSRGAAAPSETPKGKTGSVTAYDSAKSKKIKDKDQLELDNLQKKKKEEQRIARLEVENKTVRKQLDVSIISVDTIQAFFNYLGLDENDTEYAINKKLNASMARPTDRFGATHDKNYASFNARAGKEGGDAKAAGSDDEFGRQ